MNQPNLVIEVCRNCTATTFSIDKLDTTPYRFKVRGALYRQDKSLIQTCIRRSSKGDHVQHLDDRRGQERQDELPILAGRTLYGGHLFHHYGHFISEGLARLWPYLRSEFDNLCFYPFIFNGGSRDLNQYQLDILSLLGVSIDKVRILDESVVMEEAWIPSSAWPINQAANFIMNELYNQITKDIRQSLSSTRKVFVARSKKLRTSNNDEVQTVFEEQGFEVIYPELLSFQDQLEIYTSASILAGFSGSGLHNIVFCHPKTKVIEISDERSIELKRPIPNQRSANALRNAQCKWIQHDRDIDTLRSSIIESIYD
jgi:capsular polysaccharide biosynthesis protein